MTAVHVLVNPMADDGRRRRRTAMALDLLAVGGRQVVQIRPRSADTVAATIAEVVADGGIERLVVLGGDGLVHQALPAVAETGIDVGIVPTGTGNDFSRALGIGGDLETAVIAALGDARAVDLLATADGRFAASVVTAGFSGQVNALANSLSVPRGQHRYTVATLLRLPRVAASPLDLVVDGVHRRFRSTFFAIANTAYFGGGMAICPEADPADGLLDVTVVGPTSPVELARMLPTVFSGGHVRHPAVTTLRAAEVEVSTEEDVWADGERFVAGGYRAVPGALRVAGSLVGS